MVDPQFVGKTYGPVKYEIGLEKIKEYAFATGETSPFYLDEEKAAAGPYGGIVAPPLMAVVYMRDLIMQVLFDPALELNLAMLVHGEQEFQFHRLARPGEIVQTRGVITGIARKDDKDIFTAEVVSTASGTPLATAVYTFVVRG